MPVNLDRLKTGGAYEGPLAKNALPPAAPPRELAPGERVGPFRIERELARGGMGVIYLAQRDDGEFAQRVALKWMAGARDREVAEALFRRERDIVASLEHPGIARLIDGGREADDMLWFAMEYVEGEPIDVWCEERLLSPRRRVALVIELCEALSFAHQRLLIHRDIKPANVLVGADGRVKLLDFGIARLADQRDLLGGHALTPGFASPEQCAGDEVTVASDVYQVGLLLARLLGVVGPLAEGTHATRFDDTGPMVEPVPIAPTRTAHLPRDLAAILARATALVPAARYATITALAEDLRRWLQRRAVEARAGGALYRLGCMVRRHPWVSVGAAVAVSALVGLGAWLALEREAARSEARRAVAEQQRAVGAVQFLKEILVWAQPNRHGGRSVTVEEALARAEQNLAQQVEAQPALRADLLRQLGEVRQLRREPERAIALLEEARALQATLPEVTPFVRADTAVRLANMIADAQRQRTLLGDAVTWVAGDASVEAARLRVAALRFLAGNAYRRGDLPDALATIERASGEARRRLPADDEETLYVDNELAAFLGAAGDLERADEIRGRLFTVSLSRYGADFPMTVDRALSYAATRMSLGDAERAAQLVEQSSAARRRLYGERSPEVARELRVKSLIALGEGRIDAARTAVEEAIAITRERGMAGRLLLASMLHAASTVATAQGRHADAVAALEEAMQELAGGISTAPNFGQYPLDLAGAMRRSGWSDGIAARLDEAEQAMAALPPQHPRRGQLALERAADAHARGDDATARDLLGVARPLIDASQDRFFRARMLREAASLAQALDAGS